LIAGRRSNQKFESPQLHDTSATCGGYDKASKIAHYAMDNDLTLKAAALKLGFVGEAEFDRVVDPKQMVKPYVATK
jgi:fumarate hydratase class II